MVRTLLCQILAPFLSWVCRILGSGNVAFPVEHKNPPDCVGPMFLYCTDFHEQVSLFLVGPWGCSWNQMRRSSERMLIVLVLNLRVKGD